MNKSISSAVVTGATGTLGMALVEKLIENNINIQVLSRANSPRRKNLLNHLLITHHDISLESLSLENSNLKKADVFFHLAWVGTTGKERNSMYLQNCNVKYSLDALELANKIGCHTFVGAGSQAEYGRVSSTLCPETPTFPENGYGMAKLCAGQMTRTVASALGIRHLWARILSIYGPWDGKHSLIMKSINSMLEGFSPKYTSAEQMWDYLYSEDAAEALWRMACQGKHGKVYPLGSGTSKPLFEYLQEIRNQINPSIKLNLGTIPYEPNQVMYLQACKKILEEDLDFSALTSFSSGISKTILWAKNNCKHKNI